MIKAADPGAIVVAPEAWGWLEYLYSGSDFQYAIEHGWNGTYPDRIAHGGADQWPWILSGLRGESARRGVRLLDVATVHYYPQGGEFSSDTSNSMQLRRNRSTRSLWDPSYRDETWIGEEINLVPRLRDWVASSDPGLKIGITEYSWGADGHINGATGAKPTCLGSSGAKASGSRRDGPTPAASTPTLKAVAMYRNYDGNGSGFGDHERARGLRRTPTTSLPSPRCGSTDNALTVMLINKQLSTSATARVRMANSRAGNEGSGVAAQRFEPNRADRRPLSSRNRRSRRPLPPQSITLLVVPQTAPQRKRGVRRWRGGAADSRATSLDPRSETLSLPSAP